jgi:putative toxin-antitoxin system antitoxin component (TIGR02293 family)
MAVVVTPTRAANQVAHAFANWLSKSAVHFDPRIAGQPVFDVNDAATMLDADKASQLIRAGLRAGLLDDLMLLLGLEKKEQLSQVLSVTSANLWRWQRENKPLPSHVVEQILRAMQLQLFAVDVFGSVEAARTWLQTLHSSLDGMAPSAYANNDFGAQKVRGMLASLKYGGVA